MTSEKKILILNGSPHRTGIVGSALDTIRRAAETEGAVCERVDIYSCHIHPCVGCMKCRTEGVCSLPHDDAHALAEKIAAADILVVGTPTYWGGMSAQLKTAFERMVPTFMGESPRGIPQPRMKGRRAIVVAACTTPWPFNIIMRQSRGAVRSLKEILSTAGMKIRSAEIAGTKPLHGELTESMRRRLEKLIIKTLR